MISCSNWQNPSGRPVNLVLESKNLIFNFFMFLSRPITVCGSANDLQQITERLMLLVGPDQRLSFSTWIAIVCEPCLCAINRKALVLAFEDWNPLNLTEFDKHSEWQTSEARHSCRSDLDSVRWCCWHQYYWSNSEHLSTIVANRYRWRYIEHTEQKFINHNNESVRNNRLQVVPFCKNQSV